MKICRLCKEEKDLELFKKDQKSENGFASICKKCHVADTMHYRNKYKGKETPTSIKNNLRKEGFKQCQTCLNVKKITNFYNKHNDKSHLYTASSCIECLKEANKINPGIRKAYKDKYKIKTKNESYLEINADFHCIKICKKHGKLKYENIGIHQKLEKGRRFPVLYCSLCKEDMRFLYHNEDRRLHIIDNNQNVTCVTCKESMPNSNFTDGNLRSLYPSCRPCRTLIRRKSESNRMMIKRYGFHVTKQEYESLLAQQNNVCAICGKRDENKRLAIDHCHRTSLKGDVKIRGLLCQRCNLAIGQFEDNVDLMKIAISYLEKNEMSS